MTEAADSIVEATTLHKAALETRLDEFLEQPFKEAWLAAFKAYDDSRKILENAHYAKEHEGIWRSITDRFNGNH